MFPVKQRGTRIAVWSASVPPWVKNDWVSCPAGVSDAIFLCERSLWLGGEQGRERLERIELAIRLRVDFLIRVADRHRDDAPAKSRY